MILYEASPAAARTKAETAYAVMHSIGEGTFALPRKLRPDIPAALEAVIVRAMSGRPQQRFESVHGLGRSLLPMASSKRRVIWSDYYERDRPPVSPSAPPSFPDPPRPPVSEEKGTMAIDAFRGGRADATRTRSAPVQRPPAPTRVAIAQVVAPSPESREAPAEIARKAPASRRSKPGAHGGLRRAVVIAGLIALGAGGYAAWVDPDMAERIPKDVKASIKRHLPAGEPGAPQAAEETRPRVVPAETRVFLDNKPIPISGGLLPPSDEEREAARKEAEAASPPPDAAPRAESGEVDPATGQPIELEGKSPEELAAAGSPEPTALGPIGIRGSTVGPPRKPTGRVTGADVRAGVVPPYAPGDATMRALRLLDKQKKRRESVWTPETQPRQQQEAPAPRPTQSLTGAPILE